MKQQRYPFAPGVIDGATECPGYNRIEKIGYTLMVLACLAALVLIVGFSTGYFNLPGLLP